VHVVAGGLGVSALIMASAEAFAMLKLAGALYLIWLGIRAFREAGELPPEPKATATARVFREGIVVEATNPKTAAFFLAFIPQFLDTAASHPALQFMALGLISVALNTFADFIVVAAATITRENSARWPLLFQRLRQGSGLFMIGLGASLLLARRPATS
jgi:threonine/homoserine/homoserine lactone efflux protein